MAQLPTIREIANNLYAEADLDYTTSDTRVDGFSDDYEGYVNCLVSRNVIEYHKDGLTLSIAEVIGSVPDEDGDETKEWHTLDYLYSIEDSESSFEEDGTGSADELVRVIKDFMA